MLRAVPTVSPLIPSALLPIYCFLLLINRLTTKTYAYYTIAYTISSVSLILYTIPCLSIVPASFHHFDIHPKCLRMHHKLHPLLGSTYSFRMTPARLARLTQTQSTTLQATKRKTRNNTTHATPPHLPLYDASSSYRAISFSSRYSFYYASYGYLPYFTISY